MCSYQFKRHEKFKSVWSKATRKDVWKRTYMVSVEKLIHAPKHSLTSLSTGKEITFWGTWNFLLKVKGCQITQFTYINSREGAWWVIFEVLRAVTINNAVFGDMTPYIWLDIYLRFERNFYFYMENKFLPEFQIPYLSLPSSQKSTSRNSSTTHARTHPRTYALTNSPLLKVNLNTNIPNYANRTVTSALHFFDNYFYALFPYKC